MNKLIPILVLLASLSWFSANSQKKCSSPKKITDFKIATKCAIESWRNSKKQSAGKKGATVKQVPIVVYTRRRKRYRKLAKKVNHLQEGQNTVVGGASIAKDKTGIIVKNKNLNRFAFKMVDIAPTFEDCVGKKDNKKCFENEISQHIKRNFKYPPLALQKGIQGRVITQFVINELGEIEDIQLRARAEHHLLKKEAKRLVSSIPKLKPGKQSGKMVSVKYGIPITFRIPKDSKYKKDVKEIESIDAVSFASVDEIPLFASCNTNSSQDDKLNCFVEELAKHIQDNFSYPEEAADMNIEGKVHVRFIIDKKGNVTNILTHGPKNGILLEEAAYNLIKKLPKFKGGKQNGKAVNVKYTMPIDFKLQE